jgi:hypothetical protein
LAPSSSGLGRRPLKAETAVRIRSGLLASATQPEPGAHTGFRFASGLRACTPLSIALAGPTRADENANNFRGGERHATREIVLAQQMSREIERGIT